MRAVVQRVSRAEVRVAGEVTGRIGRGLVVLLGVGRDDSEAEAAWMLDKIAGLRIFADDAGKMNLSLEDIGGGLLVVSQFTLYGDTRKGRRPSFIDAAPPELASALYDRFVEIAKARGLEVGTGVFQAMMDVDLVNDGPVTLIIESPDRARG
ncbi:MAG: D-tyrosyl-tRNA(Tyr) deacylase [Blastocatellia bacterium]|nr:D-tyrosyl-tRNA(Tyr) deacylase [Blastocatellia bacterium]